MRRAELLGISLMLNDWSRDAIAVLFGSDKITVDRWISDGLLSGYQATSGMRDWRFSEREIERFIRESPWAFDALRMKPKVHSLVQLAVRIQRRDPWLTLHDIADRLGVKRSLVASWCRAGVLPYKRRRANGTGYVVSERDFDAAVPLIRQRQEAIRLDRIAKGRAALDRFRRRAA